METAQKIEIGSPEWHETRRWRVSATDAAIIMNSSPYCSPYELYWNKIRDIRKPVNAAMQRGLDLEPEARDWFEKETGYFVKPTFLYDDWSCVTYDGLNDQRIAVEIKCPGNATHETALRGEVPVIYYPQLQFQMYFSNLDSIYYLSYCPGHSNPTKLFIVERDHRYCNNLYVQAYTFWKMLTNRIVPAMIETDVEIRDDHSFLSKENELNSILEQLEKLENKKEKIRKELIEMCGDRPNQGKTLRFTPQMVKGAVDYSDIPELKTVDLEAYRKPSFQKWVVRSIVRDVNDSN